MHEHSLFRRIVSGEAGLWSAPLRGVLAAAEYAYVAVVNRRNQAFNHGENVFRIDIPVISVGNITVGGTGKTPMVIHIASRLEHLGCSPAIVARGYGAENNGPNDEERLIRSRVPGVAYVADPDRVHGAERAARQLGANVIVLDDGFQHRRLARNLDLVLIDATCPFGFDHLLPRGLLREPVASLSRADAVVVTRCDQASRDALDRIATRTQSVHSELPLLWCRHRVSGIERLDGTPVPDRFQGVRCVAFAGIAQPRAFLTTLRSLGFDVVGAHWWRDHHHYGAEDVDKLLRIGRFPAHDVLITTEKDAVKLRALPGMDHANVVVARVDVDFMDDGGTILDSLLARVVESGRAATASEPGR